MADELPPAWKKADVIGKVFGATLIPISIALATAYFTYVQGQQSKEGRLFELAVKILSEPVKGNLEARQWAAEKFEEITGEKPDPFALDPSQIPKVVGRILTFEREVVIADQDEPVKVAIFHAVSKQPLCIRAELLNAGNISVIEDTNEMNFDRSQITVSDPFFQAACETTLGPGEILPVVVRMSQGDSVLVDEMLQIPESEFYVKFDMTLK